MPDSSHPTTSDPSVDAPVSPEPASTGAQPVDGAPTVIWCRPEQANFACDVARRAGLTLRALGVADAGERAALANELEIDVFDDFRQIVQTVDHSVLCLMTMHDVTIEDLRLDEETGTTVLTTEPILNAVSDTPVEYHVAEQAWFLPLTRRTKPIAIFEDIRETFGAVHSAALTMRHAPEVASLYARLADAVDLLERICGPVELVDASHSSPPGSSIDSLRDLRGHLTLNARFQSNCCACIHVSDRARPWFRGITILGEGGSIRLTDEGFAWHDPHGELIDTGSGLRRVDDDAHTAAEVVSDEIRMLLDPRRRPREPRDPRRTTAVCEAARLSLRTGQVEDPGKVEAMLNGRT